ncbi:nucleotide-binding alpha-beta plait domain-containing protein [Tanacetum coccineum]
MGLQRSKEDDVNMISTSVYVTNFPDHTNAKELWNICSQYGNVCDSYIPNRRSKIGKRFGFVRFIKVAKVDLLVANLCTVWIGKFKLHANVARFNRQPLNKVNLSPSNIPKSHAHPPVSSSKVVPNVGNFGVSSSYIQAFKSGNKPLNTNDSPSMVLDDSCLINNDYTLALVGKLKDFGSLPNQKKILDEEGFLDIRISYMGGFWVMVHFLTKDVLDNFKSHVGVNSWFSLIQIASDSFTIDERIAWIDIEGVPLRGWTRNTFAKIASKWGSFLYEEDEDAPHFHRKHLCIKTTFNENIFNNFKIIIKGKIFWLRVKEVSGWAPDFSNTTDDFSDYDKESTDDKSIEGLSKKNSKVEETPESIFEEVEPGEIKFPT